MYVYIYNTIVYVIVHMYRMYYYTHAVHSITYDPSGIGLYIFYTYDRVRGGGDVDTIKTRSYYKLKKKIRVPISFY